ncbi:YheC/YheD family protein [Ectobacillus panaciterrae]|uniref:YheC/YheD family endospore coat-associated protein n=1 Tax=Ectobacillus panaciterrae TaxID=363872 RepID=UPI00040F4E29|nr:YheC/YheD family protein [Ectobacillus panaciterrae]
MFSTTTVRILCTASIQENEIRLSKRLASQWKIKKDDSFTVFFGLTSVHVNITSIDEKENHLICHHTLLSRLKLPGEQLLRCSYLPSHQELILGPVIAVLTEIPDQTPFLGNISSFCEELAVLSEQSGCFLYVTSLSLWREEYISGYRYDKGAWIKDEMPFPSIVHNRIHSRKTEQGLIFRSWVQTLKQYGISHFNDRFLHKWEVYETLAQFPYLQPYIPRTFLFTKYDALEQALQEFNCVFLKPIYGSQGRNIFKVTKADQTFMLDYTTFQGDIHRTYASVKELFSTLKQYTAHRPYIVQQGLDLYTYMERPVDFRMLCHKTDNSWKVTSSVARVSSPHEFVSNVAMGGEMYKLEEVLYSGFEVKQVKHMKKLLVELAVETAKCISQSHDGLYGEFGMDLALDREGNPWLLEVNVKPSKNMPSSSSIRPSVRSILQYCCSAAQQPLRRN